jgi:hypothetical protein
VTARTHSVVIGKRDGLGARISLLSSTFYVLHRRAGPPMLVGVFGKPPLLSCLQHVIHSHDQAASAADERAACGSRCRHSASHSTSSPGDEAHAAAILAPEFGPTVPAQVEAALAARHDQQRIGRYLDPVSVASLIVSIATLIGSGETTARESRTGHLAFPKRLPSRIRGGAPLREPTPSHWLVTPTDESIVDVACRRHGGGRPVRQ